MKRKKLLLCIIAALLAFAGCGSDDGIVGSNGNQLTLAGTSWRLAAFVDINSGVSREPNRVGLGEYRDDAYTLVFLNDSLVVGRKVINVIDGIYVANYNMNKLAMTVNSTLVGSDPADANLYTLMLYGGGIANFRLYPQELHVFNAFQFFDEYLKFYKIGDSNEY